MHKGLLMTGLAPEFLSLSPEFQELLKHSQERSNIEITPIQKIGGGKSGAILYLVSISNVGTINIKHLIIKLDRITSNQGAGQNEIDKHKLAWNLAYPDFASRHMARLDSELTPFQSEESILIYYSIAGESLQIYQPISGHNLQIRLETIFSAINASLLEEWNKTLKFEKQIHPQALLEKWLGEKIIIDDSRIEKFLKDVCNIDQNTDGFIFQGHTLPNPLFFARNRKDWLGARPIDAAIGLLHGDLNTNNVLCAFARHSDDLIGYYLIDFSMFEKEAFIFFDNLYLELSYLLDYANRITPSQWIDLVEIIASGDIPDPKAVSTEMAGPCAVISSGRRSFSKWITSKFPDLQDDLWGQFRLAAIAAGLNFCNKKGLSNKEKFASLLYAAAHLRRYCEVFKISTPKMAKEIIFNNEDQVNLGGEWEPFLEACNGFSDERLYFLLVGPQEDPVGQEKKALGSVNWSLVLDFDPNTEVNGLYKGLKENIQSRRALHLRTSEDHLPINPIRATYWYAARGLIGREETLLSDDSWLHWNRKYSIPLQKLFTEVAKSSEERSITIVILWDHPNYIRKICELMDQVFGDRVDFIFATPVPESLQQISEIYNCKRFHLHINQVASGLRYLFGETHLEQDSFLIPSADETVVSIKRADANWLQEEMTILHIGIGISEEEGQNPGRDFLCGNRISWFELNMHFDEEREKAKSLLGQVKDDLARRSTTHINLFHSPGAGGTTVAFRIAWDIHKEYPVIILHKISIETLGRFRLLSSLSEKPILAIVESAEISPDVLDSFFRQAIADHLSIVFLYTSRRIGGVSESSRTQYLRELLDQDEALRFARAYSNEVPKRKSMLEALARNETQTRLRVPFYFGLTAFEKDFIKLDTYVASRLVNLTDTERRILVYLSIAYQYAQQSLPSQLLVSIVNKGSLKYSGFERTLGQHRFSLLANDGSGSWRPSHYLIATEIIEQILAGPAADKRVWKQNLATWAIELIDDCADQRATPNSRSSELIIDLVRRLFVLRGDEDVLNSVKQKLDFSHLIQDIPDPSGQLAVLEKLVENFPDEPHFRAHFARFLSSQGDHKKACEQAESAILSAKEDDVLRHIYGMVLRQWAYELMKKVEIAQKKSKELVIDDLHKIEQLVNSAETEFTEARQLGPDKEHPYVSHIQLLIRTIEFGFTVSRKKEFQTFITDPISLKYQEMIDRAENLLEDVKLLTAGRRLSNHVEWVENELTAFYGDYSLVLQRWSNFLDRGGIYAPPVRRRMVRAYLARSERSWDNLEQCDIQKIAQLMEDNILEESNNEWNIRLWFQAARRLPDTTIELALDRLGNWSKITGSLDAIYYRYVLTTLKAIDGSDSAKIEAERIMDECKQRARLNANRSFSFDWLGNGQEVNRLIHFSRLGEFDEETGFYENPQYLIRIPGKIIKADRPEAGKIELTCGLVAFFVPFERRRPGVAKFVSKDVNRNVNFFLGFSYDGLRAWGVNYIS